MFRRKGRLLSSQKRRFQFQNAFCLAVVLEWPSRKYYGQRHCLQSPNFYESHRRKFLFILAEFRYESISITQVSWPVPIDHGKGWLDCRYYYQEDCHQGRGDRPDRIPCPRSLIKALLRLLPGIQRPRCTSACRLFWAPRCSEHHALLRVEPK